AISKDLKAIQKEIATDLMPFLPFGQKLEIPEEMIDAHGRVKIGGGSGFIVREDGVILTNKHVVADPGAEYTVITNDGKQYEAEILARDPINDVAILRIKADKLPTVSLGDSSNLELGQTVIAIGNALGLFKNTVSSGIVSGLSRTIAAQADPAAAPQEMRGLIQTDAAINPGNSGGPLVNIYGEAIGINAAIVFGAQNIGFAIPISSAERDLEDLKKFGHIRRPLLGIRYLTIDENLRDKLKLPFDYGALVASEGFDGRGVVEKSPADKAGIKDGDIILECNHEKITKEKTIQDFLEDMSEGQKIKLKVHRKGKNFDVQLTLAERK
ncbi:MAG: trypsin-like peptidase domain-containing protein, partial [Parcubacteria group bacterium]|nr:trypsin-like peptidase domain-containing protein [Parcubacteria group bacterium]